MKKIILVIVVLFTTISLSKTQDNLLYSDEIEQALIEKIVEKNFEYPHYEVGAAFLSGKILKLDYDKALFWLARSSEVESNDKADFLLAEIYSKGLTNSNIIDINKAIFFYERAANRGNKEAPLKAAVNYLYNDTILDQEKGLYWLNVAVKNKDLTAHQLYSALTIGDEDSKTILKQLDLVLARSNKGDHLSSFYLGLIYLKNNIIKRDLDEAKHFFIIAMSQGNPVAEELIIQIDKIKNSQ